MSDFKWWLKGIKNGFPIFMGYMVVSFAFGINAEQSGLSAFEAVLMSATNLTSAGQFAALGIISASATYIEMAFTQLVINLRYCLMSSALSQKIDLKRSFLHRFAVAFGVSDEIFAVSVSVPGKLNPFYSYGLMSIAVPGWALGTLLGVLLGGVLPDTISSALSVALYGMLIAVIVPPARKNKIIAGIVVISMLLSTAFTLAPGLSSIPSGFKIIILTLLIAGVAAYFFPVRDKKTGEEA